MASRPINSKAFPARARVLFIVLAVAIAMLASLASSKGWFGQGETSASEISAAQLPAEARHTLQLIRSGGPFPYGKDGTIFGNREQLLPKQARGYYTEYTVRTPGSKDRGARRIVVGGPPAQSSELYYTDDHYQSFRRIRE